jgi:outer membrane protein TolC
MEANAAAVQAEAELAALRISLSSNARNSIRALEAAQHTFEAYSSDLRNEADETMRIAAVSFDTGRIGYLEYLTTRQSINAIHLGYYDALIGYFNAAAAWESATGGKVISAE